MEEKLQCYLCNNEDNKGIILLNKYICRECELEITYLESNELKYKDMKEKIKDIWEDGLTKNILAIE